jgi:NAD(P)-dependent dehydrogenase (short-subunit alcohol dehydrogenase family)
MQKKTIVITGSTRGIGFGLATEFLKAGHQVVINGRSQDKVARAVAKLKDTCSDEVAGATGSVDDPETHEKLINKAVHVFGKIDIWINNAGIPQPQRSFVDIENADLKAITEINIYGLMLGTKTATNFMLKQGFGKIFNMEGFGSDGRMMKKLTLYGTTKRAVNYFTKSVSKEMEGTNVQINVLSPGMVRTDFLNNATDARSPEEAKQFKKVYDNLAEDRDVVTRFLVPRILKSTKNYDRIEFLTKGRLMIRIFKMMIN